MGEPHKMNKLLNAIAAVALSSHASRAAQLDCTLDKIRVYLTIEGDAITIQSPHAYHGGMIAEKRVFHAKSSQEDRFIHFSDEFPKAYEILGGTFPVTIYGTIDKATSKLEIGTSSNINSGVQSHAYYDCKGR
jgi:hypothetical protein